MLDSEDSLKEERERNKIWDWMTVLWIPWVLDQIKPELFLEAETQNEGCHT